MQRSRNNRWALAAMAAASLIAVPAMAQIRAGQDGHSTDSSNRVGSGGYNNGGTVYTNGYNPNQVVYGNVTGGVPFMGPHELDPRAFTGPVGSSLQDRFVRGTSGAPTSYQPGTPQYSPQLFFGSSRAVAPPTGTQRLGFTGSYVGTGAAPVGPLTSLSSEIAAATDAQKQQLGLSTPLGTRPTLIDPETGDLAQANTGEAILTTSSPLFGLQGLPGESGLDNGTELPGFAPPSLSPGGADRLRMQHSEIDRLRSELQTTTTEQQTNNPKNGSPDPSDQSQSDNSQLPSNALRGSNLSGPNAGLNGSNLNGQQANGGPLDSQNLTANGAAAQAQQQRITLVQPRLPGSGGNALQDRLNQYLTPQMRTLRANAQYVNQMNQFRNPKSAGPAGAGGPTSRPATGTDFAPGREETGPSGAGTMSRPPAGVDQPVKINSLATGVNAKGLHDLLTSAEDLMKQDKFQSAMEKYNTAEQVAPNDPLIAVGRANAELGGGFYHRASIDLHRIFESDPALLLGQYNLGNWMAPKRLQYVIKELADLAASDPKSEDPMFLLAYIHYNTGDTAKAADYLNQARARSAGKDLLLNEMAARWKISQSPAAAPDLNK